MTATSIWIEVTPSTVREGHRIRITTTAGDTYQITVSRVIKEGGLAHIWAVDSRNRFYALDDSDICTLERDVSLPTTRGLYRILQQDPKLPSTLRGLALDSRGRWWWYDLTALQGPFSPAEESEVYRHVDDLVLVDPWEQEAKI